MRYSSKDALTEDVRSGHDRLQALINTIPAERFRERGMWGDGWTLIDLVAHLAEWQRMFLTWFNDGLRGAVPAMPATGYRWNETPRLNRDIRERFKDCEMAGVMADFESGYGTILQLVESLPAERLLKPGHFAWTGKYPLTTYLGPNTASHYRFAIKVIRRWNRQTRYTPE